MKKTSVKQKRPKRSRSFTNETNARDDNARKSNLEKRLNNLYELQDRFPSDIEIEQEIEELERELIK
tara:strand:- start:2651 stop:2851 length:201 start_codon:yes stop_codon:yes gene_type:complete